MPVTGTSLPFGPAGRIRQLGRAWRTWCAGQAAASKIKPVPDSTAENERALAERCAALARDNAALNRARLAAEQARRAKSRFLAGMSHELRTSLNSILGYSELLSIEGGLNATQIGHVEGMRVAGAHLLKMITSVLDLSEVEAGHVKLCLAPVAVREVAQDCVRLLGPAAAAKGLQLGLCAAEPVPPLIMADATRLRQVLINLVANAVKFTASGAVDIRLKPDGAGTRLLIEVADTGPGIPEARRAELFQDFERLGADADGAVEGTGLGLAISAQLVALMGGRISYRDNPGGGSVFSFDIPMAALAPPLRAAAAGPGSSPDAPAQCCARRRVLVVDDVTVNREIAAAFLRAEGHEVVSVDCGAAAVAAIAHRAFDVVLMDVRMPGMDGLETVRRIRAAPGAGAGVPILALTGDAFSDRLAECLQAGMTGHLTKPFTQAALLAAVNGAAELARRDPASGAGSLAAPSPVVGLAQWRGVLASAESLARKLRSGPDAADYDPDLPDRAHALVGAAGLLGLGPLSEAAYRFERAARQAAPDLASRRDALSAALDQAIGVLQRKLAAMADGAPMLEPAHGGAVRGR